MSIVLITGSNGLVGSESVQFFSKKGFDVVGIDNNLRQFFFGKNSSTLEVKKELIKNNRKNFTPLNIDIRNYNSLEKIFKKYRKYISLIIHCQCGINVGFAICMRCIYRRASVFNYHGCRFWLFDLSYYMAV